MTRHPVDFEERVKRPRGQTGGDYPYAIKAVDLMQDFVYAALDLDPTLVEEFQGEKGYRQRRVKIPAVPASGTYVLGSVNGVVQWLATEDCN